jgi:methylated-DNA-protein-cysteine methyltransferase-like protein
MKEDISFFKRVYKVVRLIPSGRVSTYGLIAKSLGAPKSARVVGYAMNASHKINDVPAHRVVNRIGLLTGKHHFSGTNLMKELLESEGIVVKDNLITNFQNILWDPSVELH